MPRIVHLFGYEEGWDAATWGTYGWTAFGAGLTTNFTAWTNSSATAGFVAGSYSLRIRYNGYLYHTVQGIMHEDTTGTGLKCSGRIAITVAVDTGTSGLTADVLRVWPDSAGLNGAVAYSSETYPFARILATHTGGAYNLSLYVASGFRESIATQLTRETPTRVGIEYYHDGANNDYYARATMDGEPATDWYSFNFPSETGVTISQDVGSRINIRVNGLNFTGGSGALSGLDYTTLYDDGFFLSDSITAIDTGTQTVTRADAAPVDVCDPYFVRPLDVSAISAAAGTWSGTAADIDIASSSDTGTDVDTTDTVTAKPLRMDVEFDDVTGTAPGGVAAFYVRTLASDQLFGTDLQLSDDNFVSTVTNTDVTLGTSAQVWEIGTAVTPSGGDLDVSSVDSMELGFRVIS